MGKTHRIPHRARSGQAGRPKGAPTPRKGGKKRSQGRPEPQPVPQAGPQTAEQLLNAVDQRDFATLLKQETPLTGAQRSQLARLARKFLPSESPQPLETDGPAPGEPVSGQAGSPPGSDADREMDDEPGNAEPGTPENPALSTKDEGGYSTRPETAARCNKIREMIEEGIAARTIKHQCGILWKITSRSVEYYLTKVYAEIDAEAVSYANRQRFVSMGRLEKLYADAEGNIEQQLAILREMNRLAGAYAPMRLDHTTQGQAMPAAQQSVTVMTGQLSEADQLRLVIEDMKRTKGRELAEKARIKLGYAST